MPATPPPDNPRWQLAERVTDAVRRRFSDQVLAIGAHGSLAHGDDAEDSAVDLVVVTYEPGTGPRPAAMTPLQQRLRCLAKPAAKRHSGSSNDVQSSAPSPSTTVSLRWAAER